LFVLSDYPGAAIAVSSVSGWKGGDGGVVHIIEEKRYWQPRKALQAK
jgi:hypothetical protein